MSIFTFAYSVVINFDSWYNLFVNEKEMVPLFSLYYIAYSVFFAVSYYGIYKKRLDLFTKMEFIYSSILYFFYLAYEQATN